MSEHPRGRRRPGQAHLVVGVAALLAVGAVACGGNEVVDDAVAVPTVTMRLIAFKPATVTVKAGSTVTWSQEDPGTHTVTSGTVEAGAAGVTERPDDRFDSGEIATGETYDFTFDEPGTYPYFCAIHPATMRGEVRVR